MSVNGPADPTPAPKTVTLPATRAALTWDRATDALVEAAEAAERAAQGKYEAAKDEYQAARQNAHMIRQLRAIARVGGTDTAASGVERRRGAPALNGRWSRKYDACVICGTTERPHKVHGRCGRCERIPLPAADVETAVQP